MESAERIEEGPWVVTAAMDEEAVKIVNFTNGESVEFNEPGLDSILLADHVKDLPVVVVSVAGEFRQGKSFLLNFFLRYLKNEGRPNWMDDKSTPLRGFEWRAGRDRHTTGILLWKEAFVMTNSRGEKVAVLLMDTQGTFDRKSTQRENSTIFSLSVMTSSVQIYNIMRNIGENHLQHLQFFAEYGRLAQQGTGTPFQKLLFLVRDWPMSFGDGYGVEGGRELLKECLEITNEQRDEQRLLRQWIQSCFSEIDCFLMPAPGDKVTGDVSFDGRLEDISGEFCEKVGELVRSILAPENLLVKDINGRKLSCRELATFFKAYARKFQENSLPEPKSFLQASIEASNVTAIEKARRYYMREFANRPRGDLAKLFDFHRKLMCHTKDEFRNIPKIGGDEVSDGYLIGLTTELEEHFCRIFKEEEQVIQKERAKEAIRQKERLEAERKEEQRQLERAREKAEATAKEAQMEAERRAMKAREEVLKKQLDMETQAMKKELEAMQAKLAEKKEEKEHDYNMLTGLLMIPAAAVASVVCPDQVPSMARKIEKSFGFPG